MSVALEYVFANYDDIKISKLWWSTLSWLGENSGKKFKIDIYLKNLKIPPTKPSTKDPKKLELKVLHTNFYMHSLGKIKPCV